jgi:hypothetical protein
MNPNIGKEGVKFSSTNQPANRGRRSSVMKVMRELLGDDIKPDLTKGQITEVIASLWELDGEALKDLSSKTDIPVIVAIIARSLYKAASKGDPKNFLDLYTRAYGSPKQEIEQTNRNIETPITAEDELIAKEYLARKLKETNERDN